MLSLFGWPHPSQPPPTSVRPSGLLRSREWFNWPRAAPFLPIWPLAEKIKVKKRVGNTTVHQTPTLIFPEDSPFSHMLQCTFGCANNRVGSDLDWFQMDEDYFNLVTQWRTIWSWYACDTPSWIGNKIWKIKGCSHHHSLKLHRMFYQRAMFKKSPNMSHRPTASWCHQQRSRSLCNEIVKKFFLPCPIPSPCSLFPSSGVTASSATVTFSVIIRNFTFHY